MNAQDLKNSILQLAVQGRLVPQDPADEPANELLKRIRKEKERLIAKGKIRKEKPLPTIGEDEIPFEIPDTWQWVRLGDLCFKLTDGAHRTPTYQSKGIPFLSVKDMSSGKLDFSNTKFISEEEHNELVLRCNPELGDLLISKVGTTGIPAIVDTDRPFSLFVSVALLKIPHGLINIEYLYYLVYSPLVAEQAKENTKGIGNKNWVIDCIKSTLVPLPPLAEQARIVVKIEELLPKITEYGEAQERLTELNAEVPDKLRKSILQQAVQGKLTDRDPSDEPASALLERIRAEKARLIAEGKIRKEKPLPPIGEDEIPFEIPETWEWVRLGDIGNWGSGATPNKSERLFHEGGTIPWLLTGDLNDGLITEIPNKITTLALEKTSVKLNPKDSVLIAMYGATIGKVGILSFPATTNQACCACQLFQGIYNWYLFYFLMSQRTAFQKRGEGGAQPNISKEKIVQTLFPLPPLAEQQRIVERVETLLAKCSDLK